MTPSLGRVVTYTRGTLPDGMPEEYTARITRVAVRPAVPGAAIPSIADERAYDVHLAVDIHNAARGETWFTPTPIRFDDAGQANTWRWPPRV